MARTLILGASRGIGLELARQHVAAGDQVLATARDAAGMQRLTELGARALPLDVADPQSVVALDARLPPGAIDTAWYVAGVMSHGDAARPPSQREFDRVMHTNVLGAMQLIPLIAPRVAAAPGRFGFLSSSLGRIAGVSGSSNWLYRVSKAALGMVVASARHGWPDVVFAVFNPGWVRTDMGGPHAPADVADSVVRLRTTLAAAGPGDSGTFFDHDGSRMDGW